MWALLRTGSPRRAFVRVAGVLSRKSLCATISPAARDRVRASASASAAFTSVGSGG
jgi:hypothetical protein